MPVSRYRVSNDDGIVQEEATISDNDIANFDGAGIAIQAHGTGEFGGFVTVCAATTSPSQAGAHRFRLEGEADPAYLGEANVCTNIFAPEVTTRVTEWRDALPGNGHAGRHRGCSGRQRLHPYGRSDRLYVKRGDRKDRLGRHLTEEGERTMLRTGRFTSAGVVVGIVLGGLALAGPPAHSTTTVQAREAGAQTVRTANLQTLAVFDVATFGATGDGVTNDAPAFRSAIAAADAAAGTNTVFIPARTYLMDTDGNGTPGCWRWMTSPTSTSLAKAHRRW